jgi:hypothetical protein
MGYVSSHFVIKMLNRVFSIRKTLSAGMFFVAVKE